MQALTPMTKRFAIVILVFLRRNSWPHVNVTTMLAMDSVIMPDFNVSREAAFPNQGWANRRRLAYDFLCVVFTVDGVRSQENR
jgi:hypothetical protein